MGWLSPVEGTGFENQQGSNPLASSNLAPTALCRVSKTAVVMNIALPVADSYAIAAAALALGFIVLAFLHIDLRRKWHAVFGKKTMTRVEALGEVLRREMNLEERVSRLEPRLAALESIAPDAIRKIGFIRFNPFENTGGDQSFALALLDGRENGVIISSLYTREGVRVYAKEIADGTSKHPLSGEEKQALGRAMKGPNSPIP